MAGCLGSLGRHAAGPGEDQNWDLEDCPGNPEALCGIHGGARLCSPFRRTCCGEQVAQPPAAAFRSNTCQGLASLPHSPHSGCSHTRTELGEAPRAMRAWWFPPTQCSSIQQSCMGFAVGLPRVPQSRRPCGPLPALLSRSQLIPWPKGPSCLLLPRLPFTEGSPNKSAPLMPSCLPF